MANSMNRVELVKKYEGAGYNTNKGVLYICPDCYQVFQTRARRKKDKGLDMELITKASRKVFAFYKKGHAPVAACPCGFRKSNGKVQHGQPWHTEFKENNPSPTAQKELPLEDSRAGKCIACNKNGSLCNNKALPGSDRCGIHGGKQLY